MHLQCYIHGTKSLIRIIITALILTTATSAHAFGIGAYGNYNGGLSNYYYTRVNEKYHLQTAGGGLTLELVNGAKAGGKAMDWRVRAGAEALFTGDYSWKESYRINLTNYFLFGGIERGFFHVSFGPLLGMRYMYGEKTYLIVGVASKKISDTRYIYSYLQKNRRKIDQWALCLGLSLNFDFNVTDSLVVFAAVNAEQNILFRKNEESGKSLRFHTPPSMLPVSAFRFKRPRVTDMATEGSVNIGVMFRVKKEDRVDDSEKKVDESEEKAHDDGSVMKEPPGEG